MMKLSDEYSIKNTAYLSEKFEIKQKMHSTSDLTHTRVMEQSVTMQKNLTLLVLTKPRNGDVFEFLMSATTAFCFLHTIHQC